MPGESSIHRSVFHNVVETGGKKKKQRQRYTFHILFTKAIRIRNAVFVRCRSPIAHAIDCTLVSKTVMSTIVRSIPVAQMTVPKRVLSPTTRGAAQLSQQHYSRANSCKTGIPGSGRFLLVLRSHS